MTRSAMCSSAMGSDGIDQRLQTGGSAREAARQRDKRFGVVVTAGAVLGGDPRAVPNVLGEHADGGCRAEDLFIGSATKSKLRDEFGLIPRVIDHALSTRTEQTAWIDYTAWGIRSAMT